MTGDIIISSPYKIRNTYESGGGIILDGAAGSIYGDARGYQYGACLLLRSVERFAQAGYFYLFTRDKETLGAGGGCLCGTPSGSLTWFGKPVLRLTSSNYNTTAGTWYRKYSDGFIEQGGWDATKRGDTTFTITLPLAMTNTSYSVSLTKWSKGESIECQHANMDVTTLTTTSFSVHVASSYKTGYTYTQWYVCGF